MAGWHPVHALDLAAIAGNAPGEVGFLWRCRFAGVTCWLGHPIPQGWGRAGGVPGKEAPPAPVSWGQAASSAAGSVSVSGSSPRSAVPSSTRSDVSACFSSSAASLVGRLKEYRRIATRYDKLAASYLAFVQLAAVRLWLGT